MLAGIDYKSVAIGVVLGVLIGSYLLPRVAPGINAKLPR